jgi:hypothetical protein
VQKNSNWQNHVFFFWLGIMGTVGTLIGIFLSIYLYRASQIKPILTFGVLPLKTELQRPDYDKELGFVYQGKLVDSASITAVQVAIWNAGTRSIRDTDVLEPFHLVMPDAAAILSVRVKKMSRPICGFEFVNNQTDYVSGKCLLKWRILEPDDGVVLQVIYAGSARHDPTLEGVVEGQKTGIVVEHYDIGQDKQTVMTQIPPFRVAGIIILLIVCVSLLMFGKSLQAKTPLGKQMAGEIAVAEKELARLKKMAGPMPAISWLILLVAIVSLVGGLLAMLSGLAVGPPFGW